MIAGADEGLRVGGIDEARLYAQIPQRVAEQIIGAAVKVRAGNDVVTCARKNPQAPIAIVTRLYPYISASMDGTTTPNLRLESALPEILAVEDGALFAKQPGASDVLITTVDGGAYSRRQNGVAQPLIETREQACKSSKGLDHGTVEDAVEESTFERDQEQPPARSVRSHDFEVASIRRRMIPDSVFDAVQIVEDVRLAQELQQS